MAGFVQIIDYRTSHAEEVATLTADFNAARRADPTPHDPQRATLVVDRDDPNHFMVIVEFASYELAMENSQTPETGQFAERMIALCDGPPTFHNLDVLQLLEPA